MSIRPSVHFAPMELPGKGVLVLFAGEAAGLASSVLPQIGETVARAAASQKFTGKRLATLDILAPAGVDVERILVVGLKGETPLGEEDWLKLGGVVASKTKKAETVTIWCDAADGSLSADAAAGIASGIVLRAYDFDRYKTKKPKKDGEEESADVACAVTLAVADVPAAGTAYELASAVVEGVILARDLVNEPANVLGPIEYVDQINELSAQGIDVEILGEAEMTELKMFALLGVALGSPRGARLAIMRWSGGPEGEAPIAFVGKGVVFDTGGISIKPAGGMEDMKGDMGGSAAVVGLMRALAGRKAKVNVVGIVGLVENAVDGKAQRPGDIVTAMSGTTIEVINTDAEGRLVLADALWYCQDRFQPKFMIDLATLTGAVIVALGNHQAGLFSNNDELSERLHEAGKATGEKVWRLPLGPEYDKLIEGKFADIKNVGSGRAAGSITAAQFLQRFVNDVPWAHLDIAGTAMGSPSNEYNQSWASGFGVRLLNRLVETHYEQK
ncbi:putative cytosol aminopeptidase [Aureimonas sp. SA4125]|uniref:leucyl aminopeptidase n=1 Tax=Aureimonas sp. SA4125 TaxID=2826993 RepID=UPI001CC6CA80|nr:leucyl aminopeptidase [Aureimonas sp. SA4125]BDA84050.1 putative cytosol aminopeptidase [Aureimonas sp. SA4125]